MMTDILREPTVSITRELIPEVERSAFVDALFGIEPLNRAAR